MIDPSYPDVISTPSTAGMRAKYSRLKFFRLYHGVVSRSSSRRTSDSEATAATSVRVVGAIVDAREQTYCHVPEGGTLPSYTSSVCTSPTMILPYTAVACGKHLAFAQDLLRLHYILSLTG